MPGKLRHYDEYGHVQFLTISCYRRLQFFRHDAVKQSRRVHCTDQSNHGSEMQSYRYCEYDDGSVIAMGWDGSWPIV
ncbi:MAG: hypothetical protein KJ749_10935 [Planctomycetes bacterium]|nr:hypothetical protein [Planctomycetota bacterium]